MSSKKRGPISDKLLDSPSISDTSPTDITKIFKGSPTERDLPLGSMRNLPRFSGRSSIMSSSLQSKLLLLGQLISTIKFTCQHCGVDHFQDFPVYMSTKIKTSHPLIMRCSNDACHQLLGYVLWETDGNLFTISGALKQMASTSSKKTTR